MNSRNTAEPSTHPLADGRPPSWARQWGEDDYGVFVGIRVGAAEQGFRWIQPGTFWMGSPESEEGRYPDEGPRHLVTLTQGFWMADTPCTQHLWNEVMGSNPSRFETPDRPVEKVSWDDCQEFLKRLNERMVDLDARLPSEAQWERACRAGHETATWLGDLPIKGICNAPRLHDIAWYSGNSGVDYDLDEFENSADWPEKQFQHTKAGTRRVATKAPNRWGLYDMLGNVWEWCEDYWGDYPEGAQQDPRGPKEGANRVFRGGSWYDRARYVRAAYRDWYRPGIRFGYLGFRLALGGGPGRGAAAFPGRGASDGMEEEPAGEPGGTLR